MELDLEQEALAQDFMIVKESIKRSGKVHHVSKINPEQPAEKSPTYMGGTCSEHKDSGSSDNRTLAEVMGLDQKSQKTKQSK